MIKSADLDAKRSDMLGWDDGSLKQCILLHIRRHYRRPVLSSDTKKNTMYEFTLSHASLRNSCKRDGNAIDDVVVNVRLRSMTPSFSFRACISPLRTINQVDQKGLRGLLGHLENPWSLLHALNLVS